MTALNGVLANPLVWELTRQGLDLAFGVYRRRIAMLREWCLPGRGESMLDLGCGIGHYSQVATESYLGIDLSLEYIDYARRRYRGTGREFRAVNASDLADEGARFDLVLMVDFLHHLSDDHAASVLSTTKQLARGRIVSFEPVLRQDDPLSQWIIDHDRGDFIRPLPDLESLFGRAGLRLLKSDELRLGPIKTRAILAVPT